MSGLLLAVNPDGTERWRFQTSKTIVHSSPVIGVDEMVCIGSTDNHGGTYPAYFYAIDQYGSQDWRYTAGTSVNTAGSIGVDGTVYFGSDDSYVYALNSAGALKWRFETGGRVSSSPVIGPDGTVYVKSQDHFLYAFEDSSGGLADSSWPMFRHDLKHTGRLPVDPNICYGDLDGNDAVSETDLELLANDFGHSNCSQAPHCGGGIDEDIDVDGTDLAILIAEYNRSDCP